MCLQTSCGPTTRACMRSCGTPTPITSGISWSTTFSARTLQVSPLPPQRTCGGSHLAARAFQPDTAIAELRLVAMEWCPCCRADFDTTRSMCRRYKARGGWLQGLTPLDASELNSCVARHAGRSGANLDLIQFQVPTRHLLQERAARAQQRAQRRLLSPLALAARQGISRLFFTQFGAECDHQGARVQSSGRISSLAAAGNAILQSIFPLHPR
jgi:hypothetical protein